MSKRTVNLTATMTVEEVAEVLHCNQVTVRRMIARQELNAYRVGRSQMIRVRREDVESLLRPVTDDADILGSGDAA
jgi:excisionase family DNA binding protein